MPAASAASQPKGAIAIKRIAPAAPAIQISTAPPSTSNVAVRRSDTAFCM